MINIRNRMKVTNKKCLSDRKPMSKQEIKEKAVKISNAIESAQLTQEDKQELKDGQAGVKSVKKDLKSKKISIRMTETQYEVISKKCKNKQGEKLITITDFIRQAALSNKNTIVAEEHPLDRFKLAVAGEIATGITDVVHFIDADLDQRAEDYCIDDCLEIIARLEAIEEVSSYLLMPASDEDKMKEKRCH